MTIEAQNDVTPDAPSKPDRPDDVHDVAQRGLFISFKKVGPDWWRAEFRVNATDSGMSGFRCGGEGFSVSDAIMRAAAITRAAVNDPLLQVMLPPGALVAINAAHEMARAAKRGALEAQRQRLSTPLARNVAAQISDAESGTLSGIDPTCIVCADGSTPKVRDRRERSPDMSMRKRFPEGPPGYPLPGDPGVPGYYYPGMSQEQQAAMLGRHRRHHGKRR